MKLICLSGATEYKDIRFKSDERATYRELNKAINMKWPIKETVNEGWHKVNILIQACSQDPRQLCI